MADNNTEKQRVQELTDKLEQGLQDLFNSDSYRNYLATMSKFHNYSFNNTLLIAMQKPDATLVAGYKAWQKNFERHVNKGEKAIRILAPAPYKAFLMWHRQPLAKIEELEEQNYNMIDDRLNNGVEKFNREEEKKEQTEKTQARTSLKERLAAKQKEVAQGQNKDSKEQDKTKKTNREEI